MKVLFICSANCNRSPAFEREFKHLISESKKFKGWEVRSCGIWYGYPHQLNKKLIEWADKVYVMDLSHKLWINRHFPKHLWKVEVIGISDQYDVDDIELKELFNYWVESLDI